MIPNVRCLLCHGPVPLDNIYGHVEKHFATLSLPARFKCIGDTESGKTCDFASLNQVTMEAHIHNSEHDGFEDLTDDLIASDRSLYASSLIAHIEHDITFVASTSLASLQFHYNTNIKKHPKDVHIFECSFCNSDIAKANIRGHVKLHAAAICMSVYFDCYECETFIRTQEECDRHRSLTDHLCQPVHNDYFPMLVDYLEVGLRPKRHTKVLPVQEESESEDEGEVVVINRKIFSMPKSSVSSITPEPIEAPKVKVIAVAECSSETTTFMTEAAFLADLRRGGFIG
ncbi:hypothetical protein L596_006191 [Steinernema carpocapsae]|uniref:Uncharacterized protein n=1 Tax=Steinernema carpocapsae TaxID=34508 RepID=A0A4U8V734_STECR|nr:hypothetical protein L596_006191 [Steinernema carpocapsae]